MWRVFSTIQKWECLIIWACLLLHVFWPSILDNLDYLYWGNISGLTLFFKALWTEPVQFYKAHTGQMMGLLTFLQFCWQGYSLKAVQNRKYFFPVWLHLLQALEILFFCFMFCNGHYSLGRGLAWLDSWDVSVVLSKEQGELTVKLRLTNHADCNPSWLPEKVTSAEVPMPSGVCKHCYCLISIHIV